MAHYKQLDSHTSNALADKLIVLLSKMLFSILTELLHKQHIQRQTIPRIPLTTYAPPIRYSANVSYFKKITTFIEKPRHKKEQ